MTAVVTPAPTATSSRSGHHGLALRSPWYVCERGDFDRFDPRALAPVVQKYDTSDLVARAMADPRDSLTWAEEDEWSVAVPRPSADIDASRGRGRFATHSFVRMGTRKLFQPSHDRFYAVVVEVFCDHEGLPRPHPDDEFSVGLVVRRRTLSIDLDDRAVRRLAREVVRSRTVPGAPMPDLPQDAAVADGRQAWMKDGRGGQGWVDVDDDGVPLPTLPHARYDDLRLEDELTEEIIPMWRLPATAARCDSAASRSLWFGLVPTFSGDHESPFDPTLPVPSSAGGPRYDDLSTYEIRCRATRPADRAHPECPPEVFWSAATEPYRLAAFFDPEGTAHRTVSITMPDLRAVAARAAQPAAGGVAITTPPGSRLSFNPGNGTPSDGGVGGAAAQTCTFALELVMIVAFFVFSLFLPIVVFLFQLWWLLLLKFCLPPSVQAMALLRNHFDVNGGTLATLAGAAPGTDAAKARDAMDALLGGVGATQKLAGAGSTFRPADARDLVSALDPEDPEAHAEPPAPAPESRPDDPLCPVEDPP